MTKSIVLTTEEELEIYKRGRLSALDNQNYRFPIHQLGIPKDLLSPLIAKWVKAGWLESQMKDVGMNSWVLPVAYRAYPPGEEKEMSDEEKARYVEQILPYVSAHGTVRISNLGSRELVWQLVHAGILFRRTQTGRSDYVLAEEYRNK